MPNIRYEQRMWWMRKITLKNRELNQPLRSLDGPPPLFLFLRPTTNTSNCILPVPNRLTSAL